MKMSLLAFAAGLAALLLVAIAWSLVANAAGLQIPPKTGTTTKSGTDAKSGSGTKTDSGSKAGASKGEDPSFVEDPKSPVGFVRGYTWGWVGKRGSYMGGRAALSMQALAQTGTQWACIAFLANMPSGSSPVIKWGPDNSGMVTDQEIVHAIMLARQNGMKVILKPTLDAAGTDWRGHIRMPNDAAWQQWFAEYEKYQLHYAALAQAAKVELLCIGCEMSSTEGFADRWRNLVANVRKVYTGPIVYNCTWGEEKNILWWDAVDIIGISAYYPVGRKEDLSLEKMISMWEMVRDQRLRQLSAKWKRPIMFMEIGMRSAHGCSAMPADYSNMGLPWDGVEQAYFYESALRTFWDQPWFCGYVWWDWPAGLYPRQQGARDVSFCIYGKPAEQVLREWYTMPRPKWPPGRQKSGAPAPAAPAAPAKK